MRGTSLQASTSYGPYGSIHQQTGTSQTSYGYTGEQFHAGTGLLYLRARYYSPSLHAFTSRDPWAGEPLRPASLNGYNYAESNPIIYTDPTGQWIWRFFSKGTYHTMVANHYEGMSGGNPTKQVEYIIPATGRRPDFFNSVTGDVYEVEPLALAFAPTHGQNQANEYVTLLRNAASGGLLTHLSYSRPYSGNIGQPYNWNNAPFRMGTGIDWPGKLRRLMPHVPLLDFVADYSPAYPGLIVYWYEPSALAVRYSIKELSSMLEQKYLRNLRPHNSPFPTPTPAYNTSSSSSWQNWSVELPPPTTTQLALLLLAGGGGALYYQTMCFE